MRDRKQTILKPGLTKPTWHGFIDYAITCIFSEARLPLS